MTICFTDSRNIRRQMLIQAKAADEKCERLMQEINRRELESKLIKEDIQREKTNSTTRLKQLQGRVNELEDKLSRTENENRNMLVKLKNSELEVERLQRLNKQKDQEVNDRAIVGGKHQDQIAYSEMEAQLKDARNKIIEKDHALTRTTTKLEETQEMLKETTTKLEKLKALLMEREKYIDNLEVLNQRKQQDFNEKLGIKKTSDNQITQDSVEQLRDTSCKLFEDDLVLMEATEKFAEIPNKLKETETEPTGFQTMLTVPHRNLKSEGML